jgi:hypothetical protein
MSEEKMQIHETHKRIPSFSLTKPQSGHLNKRKIVKQQTDAGGISIVHVARMINE